MGMDRRSRGVLAAVALFALAQGIWLAGEFAEARRRLAESRALQEREAVPATVRQETDSALRYLAFVQSQAEVVLKERIRERVDEAVAIATAIYQQAQGKVSPATVRSMVRESLRSPRFFDGRGYYFIDDFDGNCILLPTAPQLEGTSLSENRDDSGLYIMRELIRVARRPEGAGYVRYRWYAPRSTTRMEGKIAYARAFPQLGWLIGTGDYISMVEEDLQADALKRLRSVNFPGNGSLVVIDGNGVVRLFRDSPAVEGQKVESIADGPEAKALHAIRAAVTDGHGEVHYLWASTSTGRTERRVGWAARADTWGWTVAAMAAASPETSPDADHGGVPLTLRFALPALALVLSAAAAAVLLLRRRTPDPDEAPEPGDDL